MKSRYLLTLGTSYPSLTLSGPTGTAAERRSCSLLVSSASYSNASFNSLIKLTKFSLSFLFGYSQSTSRPSNWCSLKYGIQEKMNVCLANLVSATSLNLAVPKLQPPMASRTFSLGFLTLRAIILWYRPCFPSAVRSFDSKEVSLPFLIQPKAKMM